MRVFRWGALYLACSCVAALGQSLTLVPVGSTTISEGQTVRLEVFLDGVVSPDALRGYQAQIEIVPTGGATGSVGLVDPVTPDPNNTSILIDTSRSDFVFLGLTFFVAARVADLQVGGTVFDPGQSPTVTSPAYCGEYTVTPAVGTLGTFDVCFVLSDPDNPLALPTFLLRPDGTFMNFADSCATITVVPPSIEPPNNDCVNSMPIFGGVTQLDNANATTDGPDLDVSCDEGNGVSMQQDVWYDHVATCTGVLTVSTCDDANFDTWLALYSDGTTTCSCPTDNTDLLSCSDDAAGCTLGTSEISLSVTKGDCFTLRVGGVGVAEGIGNVTITCAPDLCADAMPVIVGSSIIGSTENTIINDAIGPDCGLGPVDSPGIWYSVTGTGSLLTASVRFGATFNSRLTVYEGGCGALSCVGDSNVAGTGGESVSWCSTLGTEYLVLVHAVGGATGSFTLDTSSQNCNDLDACTNDACSAGVCVNTPNFNSGIECCTPSTGSILIIDDNNPCTTDSCNAFSGAVSHTPIPDGLNAACTDANPCTVDQCVGGACFNEDVNTFSCSIDADCPGPDSTCEPSGVCKCELATMTMVRDQGVSPIDGCFAVGEQFSVRIELGPDDSPQVSTIPIIGAQFFLAYDATTLNLLGIQPGSAIDGTSAFSVLLNESIDPLAGTIDYLVGTDFSGGGTRSPGTIAVMTFEATSECTAFLEFRLAGPNNEPNRLALSGGGELTPVLFDMDTIATYQVPPAMGPCPQTITVTPDSGMFTSAVSWASPVATDGCDGGSVVVICDPASGSPFGAGTTQVTCTADDSCGLQDQCVFDVVVDSPLLTADIQLSPTAASGPIDRCITFDLWDCGATGPAQHATVTQTVAFVNGLGGVVDLPIPGGNWTCLTASDELHTLRATSADFGTVDGTAYTATFLGSRSTGGHWLLGGNLNGDNFIDILDFGVFFPLFLTPASPDTACGVVGSHADVNGDGVVDLLDLVFISGNSLQASEMGCCLSGGVAAVGPRPVTSITIDQLRVRGLGHLIMADVNHDGVLDSEDVLSLVRDGRPEESRLPLRELLEQTEHGKVRRVKQPRR